MEARSQHQQGLTNAVISALAVPEQSTTVSKQYSNERNVATEVQAYAKISGRDWTYYVKNLEVSIGRNTDPSSKDGERDSGIDIDLGPAKVVSRRHATIKFNMEYGGWELKILGRNGGKVNFHRVEAGANAPSIKLSSGTILDIGGTQMIFILPDQEPFIPQECLENLMPTLVSIYGVDGSNIANDNPLLREVIRESNYVKTHRELSRQPPGINQQVRTFKMYGSGSSFHLGDSTPNFYGTAATPIPGMATSGIAANNKQPNSSYQNVNNAGPNGAGIGQNMNTISDFPQSLDFASDLSRDENRNIKPPYSYATMITQAILSTGEGVISLADIYKYISSNYSYYRYAKTGWQNSIRHNLSLNKAFEKVPRRPNEPGKGMKWRISKDYQEEFLQKWNSGNGNKIRRGSSVSRQLQLHMSKFNRLPTQNDYSNDVASEDKKVTKKHSKKSSTSSGGTMSTVNSGQNSLSSIESHPDVNFDKYGIMGSSRNSMQLLPPTLPEQPTNTMQPPIRETLEPITSYGVARKNPTNNALVSFTNASSSYLKPTTSSNSAPSLPSISTKGIQNLPLPTTAGSASNLLQQNPHLSPSYDSLLRSPTKSFHVTAMEAYTPERGSAHTNFSPSNSRGENNPTGVGLPSVSLPNGHTFSDDMRKTELMPSIQDPNPGGLRSTNMSDRLTPANFGSAKSSQYRNSPGGWNSLLFSSVNNTPKFSLDSDTKNGNQTPKDLNGAASVKSSISEGRPDVGNPSATTSNGNDLTVSVPDLDSKDINSSPLKRHLENRRDTEGNIPEDPSRKTDRNMLLDTDSAKITIVK